MNNRYVLLLTACITPNGMSYTAIQNPQERKEQYIKALSFYLEKTDYKIVFVNNSGEDISNQILDPYNRIEFLSYVGNDYNKELGKGYGEFLILQFAFANSQYLYKAKNIIKITGRLIIENIKEVLFWNDLLFYFDKNKIYLEKKDDKNFHIESKCFVANRLFYENFFLKKENIINDAKGFYFEHLLYNSVNENQTFFSVSEFCLPLSIIGVSGTSRLIYDSFNYSMSDKLDMIRAFCNKKSIKCNICWLIFVSRMIPVLKILYRLRKKFKLMRFK